MKLTKIFLIMIFLYVGTNMPYTVRSRGISYEFEPAIANSCYACEYKGELLDEKTGKTGGVFVYCGTRVRKHISERICKKLGLVWFGEYGEVN